MTFANSISDHDLVGMIMKKNNRKFKPRTIYTRNFAKYNEANYKADLRYLDWKKFKSLMLIRRGTFSKVFGNW